MQVTTMAVDVLIIVNRDLNEYFQVSFQLSFIYFFFFSCKRCVVFAGRLSLQLVEVAASVANCPVKVIIV